jgi:hypothetical protein
MLRVSIAGCVLLATLAGATLLLTHSVWPSPQTHWITPLRELAETITAR